MSLKAIKEVVELLAEDPGENQATLLAARDQIAALEKAATAMARLTIAVPGDLLTKDESEAVSVMRTIAKEAK